MKVPTKLYAALTAAAMLLSFSSCSGSSSQNTQAATNAPETTAAPAAETPAAESAAETESPSTQNEDTTAVETTAAPDTSAAEQSYEADSSNVKLIGRTLYEDDVLWLAQSASGVEFTFSGTHAGIDIKGDGAAAGDAANQARFAVYINGEKTLDEMVDAPEKSYDIFTADTDEDVTVKILKLSESCNSAFGIDSINVTSADGISPTAQKDLKIEFIGDSITCGYGVDDEDRDHHFSTETEDATKAYAYKTAEALDADYSLVCFSGHGIVSGYTADGNKNSANLVPPVYEQFAKTYGTSSGYFTETAPWDFSSFVPDYIVINLGTNDISYVTDKERREEFINGYSDFIKQVRASNPDAHIVCALGTMGANLNSSVKKAVTAYTEETGDENVSYLALSQQNGNTNGYAADWHPTEKSHEEAAEKVIDHLNSLISGENGNESSADAA